MKFDDVTEAIGTFGPFQKRMYILVCLLGVPAALHTMVTVFILATPDHRCAVPGLDNDTYKFQGPQHEELVRKVVPFDPDTGQLAECKVYSYRTAEHPDDPRNDTTLCKQWVYSKQYFEVTVVSELNMVCDDSSLIPRANSILMGGLLAGSLILGALSDMIGRKKTLMLGVLGQFAVAFATSFVSNYIAFIILRFLTTFFGMGMFLAAFVAGMEMVGPEQRTLSGIVIELFWCLGLFLVLLFAYVLPNWHHLQLTIACINILFVSYFWLLPESPRWLVSRGKIEEASAVVRRAAQVNKADVSEKILSLQDLQIDEGPQEKFWHLFRTWRLLLRCLIIFFNWCVISMMYYGLGLNVGNLSGDLFLNFLYANIAETVSYLFCLLLLNRTGRRLLHCFSMILGGAACVAIIFPVLFGNSGTSWVTITLSMIGKFGISAAFAIIFIFSAELYPTVVRTSAMGASSFCARIGGIVSPYIADLQTSVSGQIGTAAPFLIFGGLSVLAGIFSLWLPETKNRMLPETIEDAEHFHRTTAAAVQENGKSELKTTSEDEKPNSQAYDEPHKSDLNSAAMKEYTRL